MLFLPLLLTSLMFYGVNASIEDFSATVKVDLNAGTITPSALNVRNGTMITFLSTNSTQDLGIAQSSSLATPCIQVSPDKQYFNIACGQGWKGESCSAKPVRVEVMVLYDLGAEPLLFYVVGGCRRGMVLSVNLPANDAATFVDNAKSSPNEVTTDLSYLASLPGGCSTPPAQGKAPLSKGAIAGIVVGSVAVFVAVVAVFLIVRRRRRQRKTHEAAQNMSYSTKADHRQKV